MNIYSKNNIVSLFLMVVIILSGISGIFVPIKIAEALTCDSVTLSGYVITEGNYTRARFAYGPSYSLGSYTSVQSFFSDSQTQETISGLSANTTYYYRLEVTNDYGTDYGNIESFTTPPCQNHNNPSGSIAVEIDRGCPTALCSVNVSWDASDTPDNIVQITRDGSVIWAQNESGTATDWNVSNGTHNYCVRVPNGSNLDCSSINVQPQAQANPEGSINVDPSNCTSPCDITISWNSDGLHNHNPAIAKIFRNGRDHLTVAGNTRGNEGDYQLEAGRHEYCIRATKSDWSLTGNLDCATVTVTAPAQAQKCEDPSAENYRGNLPCRYPAPAQKCEDPSATNYRGALPCTYPAPTCQDLNATNYRGALPCRYPAQVQTCQDSNATNYGGSLPCRYPTPTCQDPNATNYRGSLPCNYPQPAQKCQDRNANNYNVGFPCTYTQPAETCRDRDADNYGERGTCRYASASGISNVIFGSTNSNILNNSNGNTINSNNTIGNTVNSNNTTNIVNNTNTGGGNGGGGNNDQEPDVTTKAATNIENTSATLNGRAEANASSVDVWFEYGTSRTNLDRTTSKRTGTSGTSNFNSNVSGLRTDTTYYFRAVAENDEGIAFGSILSFSTDDGNGNGNDNDDEPDVETENASSITESSAVLNGSVDGNGSSTRVWFEWGTTRSMTNETREISTGSRSDNFEIRITNLRENTTYYYRAVAENGVDIVYGDMETFKTRSDNNSNTNPSSDITAVTTPATQITGNSATLNALILSDNGDSKSAWFEWGTNINLGNRTNASNVGSSSAIRHAFTINGLVPGVIYYFRAVAENSSNRNVGSILTFATTRTNIITTTNTNNIVRNTTIVNRTSGTAQSLVMLTIDGGSEFITNNENREYDVTWKNISNQTLTDVVLRVILPRFMEFKAANKGDFSESDNTLTYEIEELTPNESGKLSLAVRTRTLTNDETVVVVANLVYTQESGVQEDAIAYATHKAYTEGSLLGAFAFGAGFGGSLMELLLLIILILLIVMLFRRAFRDRRYDNYPPQSQLHA